VVGIPFSGAGMNPARVLGVAIIDDTWDSDHHWLYWYGPLIGATIATLVYYIIYGFRDGSMTAKNMEMETDESTQPDGHGHSHGHGHYGHQHGDVEMAHQH